MGKEKTISLLREVVSLVLEKQRARSFSLDRLQEKPDFKSMISYAEEQKMQRLGKDPYGGAAGSSRAVYVLSPKYVLKIAKSKAGIAQNRIEVDASTNPLIAKIIAQVKKASPDYRWVISELVRPVKSSKEFKTLSGVSYNLYKEFIDSQVPPTAGSRPMEDYPTAKEPLNKHQKRINVTKDSLEYWADIISTQKGKIFLADMSSYLNAADPTAGDLMLKAHWGKTADGRIVLLDYGLDRETYRKYYLVH